MKLYGYYRSSASYRVRIALNLKGMVCEQVPVNLLKGEQSQHEHLLRNPQGLVPALEDGPDMLTQSIAIMEYLDEVQPNPPLLPRAAHQRARVRAMALAVACEIAPLNNVGVLRYLTQELGLSEEQKMQWYRHWTAKGLAALEVMAAHGAGHFCHGDAPGMADCCLVPQLYNARRFGCDLDAYPTLVRIDAECAKLDAFAAAHPSQQMDAA